MGAFNVDRMRELDTVLGPDQRNRLLAALAKQAGEARIAVRQHHAVGEDRQLLRAIHSLKGAAEIVGADELIGALRAIEQCPPGPIGQDLIDAADARIAALIDAATALQDQGPY